MLCSTFRLHGGLPFDRSGCCTRGAVGTQAELCGYRTVLGSLYSDKVFRLHPVHILVTPLDDAEGMSIFRNHPAIAFSLLCFVCLSVVVKVSGDTDQTADAPLCPNQDTEPPLLSQPRRLLYSTSWWQATRALAVPLPDTDRYSMP